ncbi:MAG: 16S rRNA (adenine(1518)-N(6)/adenine(1519)-N(6))-dimethyltransferase RsmA [Bacilli bacterium]|nr:16S rRNA (adenine(1518)-N(6)/adenine(1519)-N(6))-dimethyltransferase RsmA [Bacilli bacterium]
MNYSPKGTKEVLESNNFNFKKKFGQNFIVDENTINSIINKANIDSDTLVIEIGPGAGALTYKLSQVSKNVVCYEIDKTLENILKSNLKDSNNVEIIFDDFLKRNVKDDINKYRYSKLYVVANLPYYVTTPIIVKLIEDNINVDRIVVMVQKEVGDRFKAMPGTKDYNSLSIFINYYYDVKKVLDVSRNVFMPMPNVDSIVLSLDKKDVIYELEDKDYFFKLVRDSFKQKRKTIRNNLKEYNLDIVEKVLERSNFDLSTRAENIPINVFVDIANELVKYDRK